LQTAAVLAGRETRFRHWEAFKKDSVMRGSISQSRALAREIRDTVAVLSDRARDARLDTLAYLLKCAEIEANELAGDAPPPTNVVRFPDCP
jgi:hypothetical protein